MFNVFLSWKGNSKTGPILVTTSSKITCPDTCKLKEKGCYARFHILGHMWSQVTEGVRGIGWDEFLEEIKALRKGTLWRHNQAGDLPGVGETIDESMLVALVQANKGKKGFTYTHKPLTRANTKLIQLANDKGFTINASADNAALADEAVDKGLPTVVVIPRNTANVSYTPKGRKIVACPAEKSGKVTCYKCAICAEPKRNYIVGFRSHGAAAKSVDVIARG